MRSFALWYYSKDNNCKDKEVTVHINLWDKKQKNDKKYYFDFGFLVNDLNNIEDIFLYVPFKIEKNR
ncbi:Uncharacterised protein [[Clostridium] sordellii]|uniref:hypothetical protein n=1 Tax=Paraclostridium sordellii TaxID=1505 RepID=UPI0005DDF19F|nr:hypothetical protein [Paeniclostridium sordellii]MBX9179657.1 hypothetical protein [Paeniclostridium sordellii]CEO12028.1 Uncharacterised protein [[Clostridium] sordellii] [Paeniclostridium sordellii]